MHPKKANRVLQLTTTPWSPKQPTSWASPEERLGSTARFATEVDGLGRESRVGAGCDRVQRTPRFARWKPYRMRQLGRRTFPGRRPAPPLNRQICYHLILSHDSGSLWFSSHKSAQHEGRVNLYWDPRCAFPCWSQGICMLRGTRVKLMLCSIAAFTASLGNCTSGEVSSEKIKCSVNKDLNFEGWGAGASKDFKGSLRVLGLTKKYLANEKSFRFILGLVTDFTWKSY